MGENVAIVGASSKPHRYSFKALQMLKEYNHTPLLVHPKHSSIDGQEVYPDLRALKDKNISIDTVTMYVNAEKSSKMKDDLISLHPKRVIFNPGAENPPLASALTGAGIETVEACTLVMLRTGQF